MDDLSDEFIEKSVEKGKMLTSSMSKTIDDFRNFFKPNKQKEDFFVAKTIKDTIELVEASYENSNIKLHTDVFSQVILNILSNAKDALVEYKKDNRNIYICNYEKDRDAVIEIRDDAGGIPKEIMGKIFDPYFTTKEEGKGTGIGLYMTKTIVKNIMGGRLMVSNKDGGAKFTIVFALKKNQK
jgi:C4-dicarboxylate-specific signal transduction histidine kinase